MRPVWWCVRAGLRQDWRGLAVLTLITALMGAVVLAALAGARRTDTAVARFLQYAGPFQGQVAADPATMDKIAALPGIAYAQQGAFMLAFPVSVDGRPGAGEPGDHGGDDHPHAAIAGDHPGGPVPAAVTRGRGGAQRVGRRRDCTRTSGR